MSNEKFGTINKLAVSHRLGENTGIGYNAGYSYFGRGSGDLTYSVSLGIGINDKIALFVEPYGELAGLKTFQLDFDAGLTYLVMNNLQFDFSAGAGINRKMNFISMGCSWLMEKGVH